MSGRNDDDDEEDLIKQIEKARQRIVEQEEEREREERERRRQEKGKDEVEDDEPEEPDAVGNEDQVQLAPTVEPTAAQRAARTTGSSSRGTTTTKTTTRTRTSSVDGGGGGGGGGGNSSRGGRQRERQRRRRQAVTIERARRVRLGEFQETRTEEGTLRNLTGRRRIIVLESLRKLVEIEKLPLRQRNDAYKREFGYNAIRAFAGIPSLTPLWVSEPNTRSVGLQYLIDNPAPTLWQLSVDWRLTRKNDVYLLEEGGVRGGDESGWQVAELLYGSAKGSVLFWFHKKIIVTARGSRVTNNNSLRSVRGSAVVVTDDLRLGSKHEIVATESGEKKTLVVSAYSSYKKFIVGKVLDA